MRLIPDYCKRCGRLRHRCICSDSINYGTGKTGFVDCEPDDPDEPETDYWSLRDEGRSDGFGESYHERQ